MAAPSAPTLETGPDPLAELPDHEARTVEDVARVHREHYLAASPLQQAIDWSTGVIARPRSPLVLAAVVAVWVALAMAAGSGIAAPAFAWLELAATLMALLVAVLILVTQRRADTLAERRAQLILELALLADRRSAKIIALLEEMRRDTPQMADRVDPESDQMQEPADPHKVLAAIDDRARQEP